MQAQDQTPSSRDETVAVADHADQIINLLSMLGIDTAFGVPGGFIEPLVNALSRRNDVAWYTAKHESGAAMMCDGYYRQTARPALCFATAGPGITNLLTGIACAYQDQIPMVLITPLNASDNQGRGALQESSKSGVDVVSMLEHCTVYNAVVTHADQLMQKVYEAYMHACQEGSQGPANVSVPVEILRAPYVGKFTPNIMHSPHPQKLLTPVIDRLKRSLLAAHRPLLICGEQLQGESLPRVAELAERLDIKLVEVPMSKGSIEPNLPRYLGVYGFAGHNSATQAVKEADLIVCLGMDVNEVSTKTWSVDLLSGKTEMYTSSLKSALRATGVNSVVIGDVDQLIQSLLTHFPERPLSFQLDWPEQKQIRRVLEFTHNKQEQLKPDVLMESLSVLAPKDTPVYFDSGNAFIWGVHHWAGPRTEQCTQKLCQIGFGFASMGWAIGASVGAGLMSARKVICVTGDGSYLMSGQELATAKQTGANVLFVILNDSGYGMVKHGQRLAGAAQVGFSLPTVDFAQQAQSMGVTGHVIHTLADLLSLSHEALFVEKGPVLLDVRIDPEAVPPMGDRMKALGSIGDE